MKSKVDILDFGKLETTPADLSELGNLAKNGVVKKTECNELVNELKVILILLTLTIYLKKLTITQKLMKSKKNLLIMIMLNVLLLKNLIN